MGRLRFEEAAADLLNDYQANGKKTYADVKRRIDKHLAAYFAGRRMTAISTAEIRAYVTQRQQTTEIVRSAHSVPRKDGTRRQVLEHRRDVDGVSNREINRELTILSGCIRWPCRAGSYTRNRTFRCSKEDNVRTGFFEPEQFESVRAHLSGHLRTLAAVAYITGWRTRSEILPLEWRQIDFEGGSCGSTPARRRTGRPARSQ
jgi:integrase